MERIDDLNIKGKKIIQDTDCFLFGMDSVLLANSVNKTNKDSIIVDLGTGSAVMPVIIAAKKEVGKIIGVELQEKMYDLAKRNIQLNEFDSKIYVIQEDLKNTNNVINNITEITGKEKVDIVISNPPYKTKGTGSENEEEVKYIARHEVKCNLEDVFKASSKLLKFKGTLYLVHKPERIVDLLCIARKYNLEAKRIRFLQPTENKKPSIILIEYVLGGGNECIVEESLIEYNRDGSYTEEILKIYGMEK